MWIAVINNIPELFLGGAWTGLCLWCGSRIGKWSAQRKTKQKS